MKLTLRTKRLLMIASFMVAPFVATLIGAGGSSASALVVNYSDAVNTINSNCANNGSLTMSHAAYGQNPRLNDATGVVTYDLVILWQRCRGGIVGEYAVTGYNGDACPVVGMYHNGAEGTRDCLKYSSRHNTMPSCGSYRCVFRPTWDNYGIWQGYDGGPGDYNLHSKVFYNRTVGISNWGVKTQTSGSEYVFVSTLCDYYSSVSNRVCQDTHVYVSWVRYNFRLTPTISVTPQVSESNSPITVSPVVNNAGPTNSRDAQWQVVKFIVAPGGAIPGAGVNGSLPVAHYANGATIVSQGVQVFPRNNTNLAAIAQNIDSFPPGTSVCYALSVQPVTHADGSWSHSIPACVTISIKPKVQVLGGDLIVGRETPYNPAPAGGSKVVTSTSFSTATNLTYGSWSEYAIIPSGTVSGMASGALYVGGSNASDLCSLSLLTISNRSTLSSCQPNAIGTYAFSKKAPNMASRFPADDVISTGSVDISTLTSGKNYSINGATLDISSSQPIADDGTGTGKGKSVVINDPEATVKITSNINYSSGPLTSINSIPQLLIIAKNILIDDAVTNVDAWLIATGSGADGYINTCASVPAGAPTSATLNSTRCAAKLVVNGPVLANKLYMYRTTPAQNGAPAEVFNLRADAYVWSSAYSPGNGRIPTVTTKELPPRY